MRRPATRSVRPAALLAAALLVGAALWSAGCDFTRVDQGADAPIQQHVEALATASTPDQAERAIRGAFNKVGVRMAWQSDVPDDDLAFGTYLVTEDQIEALAVQQAAFVSGQSSERVAVGDVHAAVLEADQKSKQIISDLDVGVVPFTRQPIRVNATEAAAVLSADASMALRGKEGQLGAIALAIAADGPTLRTSLSAEGQLSPVQQFLYTIWVHQNGPFIYPFMTSPASASAVSRTSTPESCTNGCCGTGKFTSITLLYIGDTSTSVEVRVTTPSGGPNAGFVPFPSAPIDPNDAFTVSGAGRTGSDGFANTIGNNIGLFVGGSTTAQADIHTSCSQCVLPGDIYGDFQVLRLTTVGQGLCENIERCVGACDATYATCSKNASTAEEQATCDADLRACRFACHDQGGTR